ncbi:hypothetical protein MOX02_52830 [Methylobacterium oxalidis]|uniref:Uncharacterized protein n=1 Tax=Methylobacterium oxalidis TaxID=944322 RepID=A0A512JBI6_9HYPH|nr:hypothetical protein MOX02_52830 [Methylobacterium oxalidis]GLS63443.1 hypothetical protein GCM10007888_18240 [Methylobacterium oxalidis]
MYWYGWRLSWGTASATVAIVGGALGLAAAATAPINPYWYGYPDYCPYPPYYRRYRRTYWGRMAGGAITPSLPITAGIAAPTGILTSGG